MELWVRVQKNKKIIQGLVKVTDLFVEKYDDKSYCIQNVTDTLGIYKTEKRALEVLDEIQNILMPKKIIKTIDNTVKIENAIHIVNPTYETITQLDTYVYEMPEE